MLLRIRDALVTDHAHSVVLNIELIIDAIIVYLTKAISKTGKTLPYKTLQTLHPMCIYMVWSRFLLFLHTRMGQLPAKMVNFANLANIVNVHHVYLCFRMRKDGRLDLVDHFIFRPV